MREARFITRAGRRSRVGKALSSVPTVVVIALGAGLPWAGSARAAAAPTLREVVRVASGGCLSAGALVQAIGAWRGTDAVAEGLTVTVMEGPAMHGRFVVRRGEVVLGEREIDATSSSCHELGDAIALLIAVALDAAEATEKGPGAGAVSGQAAVSGAGQAGVSGAAGVSGPGAVSSGAGVAGAGAVSGAGQAGVSGGAGVSGAGPAGVSGEGGSATAPGAPFLPAGAPARGAGVRPLTVPRDFGARPGFGGWQSPRLALEVTLGGGGGFEIVPAGVALVTASVGLRLGPKRGLAGLLRAGILATGTGRFSLVDGQVEARLGAGRLDACALWMPARVGLEACAGVAAGWLAARGIGFDADAESGAPWVGAAGRLAGRLEVVGPFALFAGADALVPVLTPRLQVKSTEGATLGEVGVPPVGVGIFLGAAFTFP